MKRKKITAILLAMTLTAGFMFTGCGSSINEKETFATLGDEKISMGLANFMAKYEQATYETIYMGYFGEDMWQKDLFGSGNTLETDIKTQIEEQTEEMYLLKEHMADFDISVTEDDEKAIKEAADAFYAENTEKAIKQMGAENRENVEEFLRLRTIQSKMHERIIKDADTTVSDEEAAQRTFSYAQIGTKGHYNEESKYVEYTEDEKKELKKKAKELAKASDFEAAANAAEVALNTKSYGNAEDESAGMDKAVLEAADKLSEGQISDVIETEGAYYVLRLDSEHDKEATEEKRKALEEQKREDYYKEVVDGWKKDAKWKLEEKAWEKVTFKDHFKAPEVSEDTETVDETEITEETEE